MTQFQASGNHPLLQTWETWLQDQLRIIPAEAETLAARGLWLGCNDPFTAALYQAHSQGLFGPTGLRRTSLYDPNPDEATTDDATRVMRRRLTAICDATWQGREIDAEGARERLELEQAIDAGAFFTGDGFAIRVDGTRSTWRLVHRDRVANPDGKSNSPTLRDGFRLQGGRIVGLWVTPGRFAGMSGEAKEPPRYIPWTAADGTPNVIHKRGMALPGMLRGVSRLSPMIIMERQLAGVLESHVAAKRLQAIYGMIVEAADQDEWAKAQENGTALGSPNWTVRSPLGVWVKPPDSGDVQMTSIQFNGADLKDYLTICYKVLCATLQMPVDVVLCQMGEASLSSARAGLDQWDRTCQSEQEYHIATVTAVIDQVAIADAIAIGSIALPTGDWAQIMVGKYSRPPKYSTDRLKDANTIKALVDAGISKTTAYSIFGFVYEDEVELGRAEGEFEGAQSVEPAHPTVETPDAPAEQPADNIIAPAVGIWVRAMARLRSLRISA